jgi:8-oxo-dGTP pyrophosphatase MutT (NUDIX family)
MDKSFFVSRFLNYSRQEVEKRAAEMLSGFQKMHFERYYANPFPLRKSAVMIMLFVKNGRLETIMIERTDIGKHAGQISFPGGKSEPSDADSIETAIRETFEEIGVKVSRGDVVGELPSVKIPVSGFEVFPVVAFVNEIGDFTKSDGEVKKVLEVDIEGFRSSLSERLVTVSGKQYEVPSYLAGNSIVWGATAMIMSELLCVIK